MIDDVCSAARENAEYFRNHRGLNGQSLYFGFRKLVKQCEEALPLLDRIKIEAPRFDLDRETPGNGYQSFVVLYEASFTRCLNLCLAVREERQRQLFFLSKAKFAKDLADWNSVLHSSHQLLTLAVTLLDRSGKGEPSLFSSEHRSSQQILNEANQVDSSCFYGRHGGFYVTPSAATILNSMLSFLAGYSEFFFGSGTRCQRLLNAFLMSFKYMTDADHRAVRIKSLRPISSVQFCKGFWSLADSSFMKVMTRVLCPSLQVNQVVLIDPDPLRVKLANGGLVDVPPPNAHGPARPIQVRLISARRRPGMPGGSQHLDPSVTLSDSLVIHCHGGAFVALSSEAYECYLRHWAVHLDAPIVSVDYSLAPEFPFPRSIQEIAYVYAWVLNRPNFFGTTAEKIVFIGDSAGGNLALSTTLLCSYLNLPIPRGICMAYAPLVVHTIPSASRLLVLTDVLLPCDFVTHCQQAYAGHLGLPESLSVDDRKEIARICLKRSVNGISLNYSSESWEWPTNLDLFCNSNSPLLSPLFASDAALKKLPPMSLLCTNVDFCLDESVEFSKRCRRLGRRVKLDILPGLPHGFLNLAMINAEAGEAALLAVRRIRELLE